MEIVLTVFFCFTNRRAVPYREECLGERLLSGRRVPAHASRSHVSLPEVAGVGSNESGEMEGRFERSMRLKECFYFSFLCFSSQTPVLFAVLFLSEKYVKFEYNVC